MSDIRKTLISIGWSMREFARRIDRSESTVTSWVRRGTLPASEYDYAARVAAAVKSVPRHPPSKE